MKQIAEIILSMFLVYGAYWFFTISAQLFGRIAKSVKKRRDKPPLD